MKKILILASIGCQNLGDELILKNEIKYLENKYGKCSFIISTHDKDDIFYKKKCMKFIEYFPYGIKNPKNIFRNVRNLYHFIRAVIWSDLVIFGGGGIFYDNEVQSSSNPLKLWYFRSLITKILRKELNILGVSISIKNKKNLKLIKKIFKKASTVKVRDSHSKELLEDLNIKSELTPDFVFSENSESKERSKIGKYVTSESVKIKDFNHIGFKEKTVGIALRSGYIKNEKDFLNKLIEKIINDGGKVILIPHSFHKTDYLANDYNFMKDFIKTGVSISENMEESYKVYKENKIDILISMRLHSTILGYSYNIRTIPISYASKTESIIKTLM